jgi:hypothetical protein
MPDVIQPSTAARGSFREDSSKGNEDARLRPAVFPSNRGGRAPHRSRKVFSPQVGDVPGAVELQKDGGGQQHTLFQCSWGVPTIAAPLEKIDPEPIVAHALSAVRRKMGHAGRWEPR